VIYLSTIQRVAKNTGIIIGGEIVCKIIALFTIIYLARYLHPVEFGQYSFVLAYLAFFGIITDLGLHAILVREMSRDSTMAPKLIGNAYIIKLTLTIFAVVLSMIVINLISYPSNITIYIYIAVFTLPFMSFSDLYTTIFQANLKMKYNIIARIIFRILLAILILWVIFSHGTLMGVMIALVFSELVKTLICYSFSRKFVKPRFEIDFGLWKYLLKASLPIALSGFIWVIHHNVDVVMLSIMQGDAPIGIYSAACRLVEPLGFLSSALMISMFPLMSIHFINSKEKLIKSYRLSLKHLLIIALPVAIVITFIADKIILLVYGTPFAGSTTVLQILIWAFVFVSVNSVLTNLLISMDMQKLYMLSAGLCAIVNVTLNLLLIPILSYNGAAIATVVTNVVLFGANFYFVSKHLQVLPIYKIAIKPVISGLLMGAFIYYFVDINIFLLVPLAGIVYWMALLALKTFSKEDWDIVKKVLGRE
jgi:O-antigen/teichoic acid export membrane protein